MSISFNIGNTNDGPPTIAADHANEGLAQLWQKGGVVQHSFVVEDINAALDWWTKDLRVGPFFLAPRYRGPGRSLYRGEHSDAEFALAAGFIGTLSIELLQPLDDHPSVFRDTIERSGYGFHHVGVATQDVDASIREYEAKGYSLAYLADIPMGGYVAYMEPPSKEFGFVELSPASAGVFFDALWRQSLDWDGRQPVRAMG